MKRYQKLLLSLSLLTFISCGSSGGGHDSSSNTSPSINTKNIEINNPNKIAIESNDGSESINGESGVISGVFKVGIEA